MLISYQFYTDAAHTGSSQIEEEEEAETNKVWQRLTVFKPALYSWRARRTQPGICGGLLELRFKETQKCGKKERKKEKSQEGTLDCSSATLFTE